MTKAVEGYDIAKETIVVLRYFDDKFVSKISKSFLNQIYRLSEKSNITVKIDKSKKLEEQDISEETKCLISYMYYKFVADKSEKSQIMKIWIENENAYQIKLQELYDMKNIFPENNVAISKEELPVVTKKENLLDKLIKLIKKIICKK